MNANIVYSIVKALSVKEQAVLYNMLKKDAYENKNNATKIAKQLITRSESDAFILKSVFIKAISQ